jgi:hypothetical protein
MAAPLDPVLAPPGAGLPGVELLVGRLVFALRRRTGSREVFARRFREERAAICGLVGGCDPSVRRERVLIRRLPGLEDSSRYWSVWMTLEHLRITNEGFARFIAELGRGRVPEGRVSTAAVKPSPDVTVAVEEGFGRSCDSVLAAVEGAPELETGLRHAHPWFGPLDAYGWFALAATHMAIHRNQVARILTALTRARAVAPRGSGLSSRGRRP